MDLLGTKAMAIANSYQYRKTIEKFHDVIKKLCRQHKTIEIYVFSDCSYIEEADFTNLCMFFKDMREMLLEEEICFNAAICKGKLCALKDGEKDDKYTIVDFISEKVVKVYGMQSCFTGAGIFIDPRILETEDLLTCENEILIDSIYSNIDKRDGKFIYKRCKDIKFQRNSEELLQFILNIYVKTYLLDRRAARYYYTIYTTYINEQDINRFIADDYKLLKLIVNFINKLCDYDGKIVIIMVLINRLYNAIREEYDEYYGDGFDENEELYEPLSFIYEKFNMENIFNIRDISSMIISDTNKLLFTDFLIKKMKEY